MRTAQVISKGEATGIKNLYKQKYPRKKIAWIEKPKRAETQFAIGLINLG
jgi:hypothetical protein